MATQMNTYPLLSTNHGDTVPNLLRLLSTENITSEKFEEKLRHIERHNIPMGQEVDLIKKIGEKLENTEPSKLPSYQFFASWRKFCRLMPNDQRLSIWVRAFEVEALWGTYSGTTQLQNRIDFKVVVGLLDEESLLNLWDLLEKDLKPILPEGSELIKKVKEYVKIIINKLDKRLG